MKLIRADIESDELTAGQTARLVGGSCPTLNVEYFDDFVWSNLRQANHIHVDVELN